MTSGTPMYEYAHFQLLLSLPLQLPFFFFTHAATTVLYTLSLHDALPIYSVDLRARSLAPRRREHRHALIVIPIESDRKSTRLNSSHQIISYAVFCLKKKTTTTPSSS